MPQITVTKIAEADSTLVVKFDLLSDGSGELVNYPLLYPSSLNPPQANNRPTFRILQAWYGMVWFDFTIGAGTLQPAPLWTFARDCDSHIDFRSFGGIVDPNAYAKPPSDDNGVLTISTNGFIQLGSQGILVLSLAKTNTP